MKFLEKIGIGKKKKQDEIAVAQVVEPQQPKSNRLMRVLTVLNQPMGGGFGSGVLQEPKRTPMEKQLGIPEFVSPRDRAPDFTTTLKPIEQTKKEVKKWRPKPGMPYKDGSPW